MISDRTNKLFKSLAELFGVPAWRQGQDKEKIMQMWDDEIFKFYEDDVLEKSFFELFRYGKVTGFPKMAQVKAMLMNKETKDFTEKNNLKVETTNTDAFLEWSKSVIRNNLGITAYDTECALHNTVNRIDCEFPPLPTDNSYRTVGELSKVGILNNVFWQYLNEEMDIIIKDKLNYLQEIRK